jgi:hypothetical protein
LKNIISRFDSSKMHSFGQLHVPFDETPAQNAASPLKTKKYAALGVLPAIARRFRNAHIIQCGMRSCENDPEKTS